MSTKSLTKSEDVIKYTPEQVALVKTQIAPKATDDELKLFLYQAQRTGLDALSRQIYCIHRKQWNGDTRQYDEKMTIQTSIDGFRVIAERSGNYGGQSEPVFGIDTNGNLLSCKVSVFKFRGDTRYEASVGVAYWSEYVPIGKDGQPMSLWKKMPHTMLSKVAEALALRKSYPQDLSGLYTTEEMTQADLNTVEEKKTEVVNNEKIDIAPWKATLDSIKDKSSLVSFYNVNKKIVDSEIEIKKLFTVRQEELKKELVETENVEVQQ